MPDERSTRELLYHAEESISDGGRRIWRNNGENEGVFAWNRVDEAVEIYKRCVVLEKVRPSAGEPRASVSCILSENVPTTEVLIDNAEFSRKPKKQNFHFSAAEYQITVSSLVIYSM